MSKVEYTPEQRKAISTTDGKMIVSASAGSGKTTVMVERIVELVKRRVGLEKIVALTFTDASARDMRAKLERRVAELCDGDVSFVVELEKIPFVEMCTVDSLCKRIVTEYFEIAGIDPAFDVLDDGEKEAFSKRAFERAVEEMALEDGFYALTKCFDGQDKLKVSLEKTAVFLASLPDEDEWLDKVATSALTEDGVRDMLDAKLKRAQGVARELLRATAHLTEAVKEHPYVATRVSLLGEVLEADVLPALPSDARVADYTKKLENLTGDYEALHAWGKECAELIKEVRDFEYVAQTEETKALTTGYVRVLKAYLEVLASIKKEENKFDFADVERMALTVLGEERVRERVLEKFSYVFVDEYQDINELQARLIDRITAENKFMVGDVKQSIYAFRHAEPRIFVNTLHDSAVEPVVLADNFRSAGGVIDAVNAVFSHVMDEESGVDYQKEQMRALRKYDQGDLEPAYFTVFNRVDEPVALAPVYSVEHAVAETPRSEEVEHVAKAIRALVNGKRIYDPSTGEFRPVRNSDIAVIVRARGAFYHGLIKRLDELGVPVSADRTRSDAQEIKVIIDLIKLLDNGMQDVPLMNVMTNMFGLSAGELVQIAKTEKTFFDSVEKSEDARVATFRERLRELRFTAGYRSVDYVLKRAIEVSRYYDRLSRAQRENVERMIETLSCTALNESVEKFLQGYEKLRDELVGVPTGGEDAVKIMTMHASKGLEFPIVFVCDLGSNFNESDFKGDFIRSKTRGIVFKNVDNANKKKSKNTAFCLASEEEKMQAGYERARLLYVAMTRAKNHLLLSGTQGGRGAKPAGSTSAMSFLQMLKLAYAGGAPVPPDARDLESGDGVGSSRAERPSGIDVGALKKALEYKYPYAEATETKVKFAVTALAVRDDEEWSGRPMFDAEEAMRAGTVYHKVMEEIPFATADAGDVKKALDKMVELHTITRADADGVDVDLIARALNAPVIRLASRASRTRREYKFMLSVPGVEIGQASRDDVLVQGVIDLLIWDGDGVILVDYKLTARRGEELRKKYKDQLDLYAKAVESGLGLKVKRRVILSLKTGEEFDV